MKRALLFFTMMLAATAAPNTLVVAESVPETTEIEQSFQLAPPAIILIVQMQRILEESAAARDIADQMTKIQDGIRAEVAKRDTALKTEEENLVAQKDKMKPEEFSKAARVFEDKVRDARKETQLASEKMQSAYGDAMNVLRKELTPVLAEVMKQRGATVMLDETQVIFSATGLDVTGDIIRRLDKIIPVIEVVMAAE